MTDFTPLEGCKALLWPDADKGGFEAMIKVAEKLERLGAKLSGVIVPGEDWPKGADVADFPEWDRAKLSQEIKSKAVDPDRFKQIAHERYGIMSRENTTPQAPPPGRVQKAVSSVLPSPAPFPLEVFPQEIQESILAASKAFSVPTAVPATTFLACAGASIGLTRGLVAKGGWVAYPNLFWVLVARSGMGKSPCSKAIMKPLREHDARAYEQYRQDINDYDTALEEYEKAKKRGETPDRPQAPTCRQSYVEDATSQALGRVLADNPRGVLWYRDEIKGLLADLGRYDQKGGADSDKTRLLSAYDCGEWRTNRISRENDFIPRACVSLFGTTQPKVLPGMFKDGDVDSGFLPRFIFIRCEQDGPPLWSEAPFQAEQAQPLTAFLEHCLALDFDGEGESVLIGVSKPAHDLFVPWYNLQVMEQWNNPDLERFEELAPKTRAMLFKLCIPLHVLDCWLAGKPDTTPVSADTMERAITLTKWVKRHQRQIWDMLSSAGKVTEASPLEKRVAVAIVELADKGKIEGGRLPTALIVKHLNRGLENEHHVKADPVGKSYKKLGLAATRTRSGRCVAVSPSQLEDLRQSFLPEKGVTGVTPVTKQGGARVPEGDTFKTQVSHPSPRPGLPVTPVTPEKKGVTAGNPHEIRTGDACDACDTFSEKNPQMPPAPRCTPEVEV